MVITDCNDIYDNYSSRQDIFSSERNPGCKGLAQDKLNKLNTNKKNCDSKKSATTSIIKQQVPAPVAEPKSQPARSQMAATTAQLNAARMRMMGQIKPNEQLQEQPKAQYKTTQQYSIFSDGSDTNVPNTNTNTKTTENNNIVFYDVYGLGCDSEFAQQMESSVRGIDSQKYKLPMQNINVRCSSNKSAVQAIAKTWINATTKTNALTPLNNSNFVVNLFAEVLGHLKVGKKVFLFGHSYGGAILNKLALKISQEITTPTTLALIKEKVFIYTFGSIYIPPQIDITKVNIENYLGIGDVAQRVNQQIEPLLNEQDFETISQQQTDDRINTLTQKLSSLYTTGSNIQADIIKREGSVIWIAFLNNDTGAFISRNTKGIFSKIIRSLNPFGNAKEWMIHNYYTLSYLTDAIKSIIIDNNNSGFLGLGSLFGNSQSQPQLQDISNLENLVKELEQEGGSKKTMKKRKHKKVSKSRKTRS
jgi:hypothetical protein